MDQKLPVIGKKFWKIVRVAYFMLRKGLSSKRKLMFDLNLLMKRGKIAGKAAFQNLLFQGHNNINQSTSKEYYEFSCSNSPAFGRTPTVRQLRITDSPFHLREADNGDMISHVDEKADEFISRFYRDLRREVSAFA
ncbi:hypothetical protein AABB24_031487 [Solanum stoloniferum]|uniref:Avr9/Cf-9 rapidly elicited protein 146 n=1 Tax=Solanum stoloniferum TaxID=62892 RepID=A0ABD2RTT2_9SOLN